YAGVLEHDASASEYYARIIWKDTSEVQHDLTDRIPVLLTDGAPHHLRFEVLNHTLSLYVNGTLVASGYDTALTNSGTVGIRGRPDVTFDNFRVRTFDALAANDFTDVLGASWVLQSGGFDFAADNAKGTAREDNLALAGDALVGDVSVAADVTSNAT